MSCATTYQDKSVSLEEAAAEHFDLFIIPQNPDTTHATNVIITTVAHPRTDCSPDCTAPSTNSVVLIAPLHSDFTSFIDPARSCSGCKSEISGMFRHLSPASHSSTDVGRVHFTTI